MSPKDKTIIIYVEGGVVQDVEGLPDGYVYEVIDADILEDAENDGEN